MLEKRYKLSVVVLVYNTEPYLRECLDSLVYQTLDDIEIIIVNDSSPDNSHLIIEEYSSNFDNIKVINQKNSGGAIAGNNGMKIATGEYITIMDSDDIVPLNAYEKLYNEAKNTNSDIIIGRPNILINGVQKEINYQKERNVWKENRIITSLLDFPDIFYDGFYWNKIYKRDLLFQFDCFMPPGMLYADRPMVHKAFLYAKKISIINDVVYLWRKREVDTKAKSITQLIYDLNNFKDRIDSLNYQIDYFNKYGNKILKNEFLKRNIERLFFPIKGILHDREFRDVYLKELKRIFGEISNIYENELGITKNLYVYMILHDLKFELLSYVKEEPKGRIIGENGKFYWTLPYFRDKSVNIPDELFQITTLFEAIIKVGSIFYKNDSIILKDITVPGAFKVNYSKLVLQSRININDRVHYKFKQNANNCFGIELNLNDFNSTNIYDIYLIFNYDDNKEIQFRFSKKMLKETENIIGQNQKFRLYFTAEGNLSFQVLNFNITSFKCDNNKLILQTSDHTNGSLEFYLKDRISKEKIYLNKTHTGGYEIKWNHFIEKYCYYDLFFKCFDHHFRVSSNAIFNFEEIQISFNNILIDIYETNKNNISIKSSTPLVKLLSKFKKIV